MSEDERMNFKKLCIFACITMVPLLSFADDRPGHYSGEKAETLQEALKNLHEYSDKLGAIVHADSFGTDQLHSVHEMTYTLENALQTLEKELQQMTETLESVHIASEQGETSTVEEDSMIFLEKTRVLLQRVPQE